MPLPKISGITKELDSECRNLWRAVVLTAIRDALGLVAGASVSGGHSPNNPQMKRLYARQAIVWFERGWGPGSDLGYVCGLAGFAYTKVRTAVLQAVYFRWGDDPYGAIEKTEAGEFSHSRLKNMAAQSTHKLPVVQFLIEGERGRNKDDDD